MTDRDVYSQIDAIVRDGKRRINDADRLLIAQLLGVYQESRHTIAAELILLETQIAESIASNRGDLTEAWMRRQDWYQQLDQAIQAESARLEATTRGITIDGRAAGITEGGVTGRATIQAAPGASFTPGATERLASAIQPGSPLDRVLGRYGVNVEESLRTGITQGIIQGEGSSNITRRIVADVGEFIPERDASRIVRTETMRAYRGAYRDQVESLPADMVAGWRWISGLDTRTCAICLGLHNHIFVEYPDYFHVQCRCTVAPYFSERYAPPQTFQTGDEWLATQGEDVQLSVLGPSRYELWRNEGVPMRDMVRFENDPVWGGTTRLIPARDLQAMANAGMVPGGSGPISSVPAGGFSSVDDAKSWFEANGVEIEGGSPTLESMDGLARGYQRELTGDGSVPGKLEFVNLGPDGNYLEYAWYSDDPGEGWVRVNLDSPYWTDQEKTRKWLRESGWTVDDSPEAMVSHEIGHWKHFNGIEKESRGNAFYVGDTRYTGNMTKAHRGTAAKVSQYATTNQYEFIAETYAGIRSGKTFDDDVMNLYRQWGGPDTP